MDYLDLKHGYIHMFKKWLANVQYDQANPVSTVPKLCNGSCFLPDKKWTQTLNACQENVHMILL